MKAGHPSTIALGLLASAALATGTAASCLQQPESPVPGLRPDTTYDSTVAPCIQWGQVYRSAGAATVYDKVFGYYLWYGFDWDGRQMPQETWHYLIKLDLSGIPDSAEITGARLRFFCDSPGLPSDVGLVESFDPPAETLFEMVDHGQQLHPTLDPNYGWNSRVLNASGVSAVMERRQQGWMCLSLRYRGSGIGRVYIEGGGDSAPPMLIVDHFTVGVQGETDGGVVRPELRRVPGLSRGGDLVVHYSAPLGSTPTLEVVDAAGRRTCTRPIPVGRDQTATLNLSSSPAGVYFLRLRTTHGSTVRRFVRVE